MCPRHLGAAAVIVRSFARIHETNLKKQGILPLIFTDPADYDKIRVDDRISIKGLASLEPGRNLEVVLSHADGQVHTSEVEIIQEIGQHLRLSEADVDAIMAIFIKDTNSYYKLLEVDPSGSDQDIKKAYRSMATRFHPDKVQHLGPEFQAMAEDKFKAINEAYQQIKTERGM